MGQLYGMYDKFKNAKSLNVSVIRNGRPSNITINLP
jgi:hypothetical protein